MQLKGVKFTGLGDVQALRRCHIDVEPGGQRRFVFKTDSVCGSLYIAFLRSTEMRNLMKNFKKSESGASLVEYAVALIVVTIIGGAGVIALGTNAGALAELGCDTAGIAASEAADNAGTGVATAITIDTDCGA